MRCEIERFPKAGLPWIKDEFGPMWAKLRAEVTAGRRRTRVIIENDL